jgi:DNA-binding NtrC family response regulator
VIPFFIPPLREHTDDIAELAEYFTKNICEREGIPMPRITRDALEILKGYNWPGNVRELEHIIERVVILSKPELLDMGCFLHEPEFAASADLEPEQERIRIEQALESCGGNRTKACRMLGISRRTLYNKLARYNLS